MRRIRLYDLLDLTERECEKLCLDAVQEEEGRLLAEFGHAQYCEFAGLYGFFDEDRIEAIARKVEELCPELDSDECLDVAREAFEQLWEPLENAA